jgi:hypothetical protein
MLSGNMLFPLLKVQWLQIILYYSPEYHISSLNIIILFWKYLVDIRCEAWLNLFWEHINRKLFAVRYRMVLGHFSSKTMGSGSLKLGAYSPSPAVLAIFPPIPVHFPIFIIYSFVAPFGGRQQFIICLCLRMG